MILYREYIIKVKFICWLFTYFRNLINSCNMEHNKIIVVYSYGVQLNEVIRTGEYDDPECDPVCIPLQKQNATRSL